jgi:hypothetical protein
MTADAFRTLALALPEAVESAHGGHPDFRVNGRVFASLGAPDDNWGMVALTPEEQSAFLAAAPKAFRPSAGAWGRRGYTGVHLASVETKTAQLALSQAHRTALKKKTRKK